MAEARKGRFVARIEPAEPGLYRAVYRGELNPDAGADKFLEQGPQVFPDMHLGDDPAALKSWVEEMARGLGYTEVTWEELPESLTARPR